jgi:anti-sigma regulatory factor (Ser/Thr protein kinase)
VQVTDGAELVTSELVTNAVQASHWANSVVSVCLALQHDRLFVLVWDCCTEPPSHCHANYDDESGRGLAIVDVLSEQWGTCPVADGKVVWAQLALAGKGHAAD